MRLRSILILVAVLTVAIAVYFVTRPIEEPVPPPDPREYVWNFDVAELWHIRIELPNLDMSESFLKHEDSQWCFDAPSSPRVDPERWGGIPLILSGPRAERLVVKGATDEELAGYGFTQPLMNITLAKEDGEVIRVEVGDSTLDGRAHYVRLAESGNIYTVDASWYYVIGRLVVEPPYLPEE